MKKTLAIILSICFVLCLTACNKDETASDVTSNISSDISQTTSTENQTSNSTETSEPAESSEPTESSKPAESSKPSESSKPTHTHEFSAATCTEAPKCSCGATDGSALGHKWQDATCKAPKTCSVCKATEGEPTEHKYENDVCTACKAANPDPWLFKNGDINYIIKYNQKTSQNIMIDLEHLNLPEEDPNYEIVVNLTRDHISQVGEWIYFFEKGEYSTRYTGEGSGPGGVGSYGMFSYLCRIKEDGTNLEVLPGRSSNSENCLAYVLGFDGPTLYFLVNGGWEPGGDLYSIDLSKSFTNIVDNAKSLGRFMMFPLKSYIENGTIYITGDPDYDEGDYTIPLP